MRESGAGPPASAIAAIGCAAGGEVSAGGSAMGRSSRGHGRRAAGEIGLGVAGLAGGDQRLRLASRAADWARYKSVARAATACGASSGRVMACGA